MPIPTNRSNVKFKFDGIDLPFYLGYLPKPLPITVHNGRLEVDPDLSYRAPASTKPELQLAGRLDLTTLDLREPDGGLLLFVPLLEVRLAPSHPFRSADPAQLGGDPQPAELD